MEAIQSPRLGRREFLVGSSRAALNVALAGTALPTLLAACGRGEPAPTGAGGKAAKRATGEVIVGDVIDHALTSDEWPGAFGFVTFRLHRGVVDGEDVFLIRTDASDESLASREGLVFAPRIGSLARRHAGRAYLVGGGANDEIVLSSEPGRPDYTPAWRIHRVTWTGAPRPLSSASEVEEAGRAGDARIERTDAVLNAAIVKWSSGEMPADSERTDYLGGGQLLEPPDVQGMRVTFKLHECFPGVRYIVCDTSLAPMAAGMHVAHSPGLAPAPGSHATGRTNVFMNGLEGPGPMGFQPSVFDSQAGDRQWSPYWDHMTYAWNDGARPRVLTTEDEIHAARDAGDLEEFRGTPDTGGKTFTVNCPVPVLAPDTFRG